MRSPPWRRSPSATTPAALRGCPRARHRPRRRRERIDPRGREGAPTPKPLTEEQRAKILTQVEFYFSDANLPTDAFLMKRVRADPEGWVPLGVICGFNRVKQLLKKHPHTVVADILAEKSTLLIVDDARAKLRRAQPLPDFDLEDVQSRTVVAENFGADTPTIDGVRQDSCQPAKCSWFACVTRGCKPPRAPPRRADSTSSTSRAAPYTPSSNSPPGRTRRGPSRCSTTTRIGETDFACGCS